MIRLRMSRRRVLLGGLIIVGLFGCLWFARPRDVSLQLAIAKYEEIRPGMTTKQVEEVMKDLPSDTTYASMAGGIYTSASHRFNINAHYDANGILQHKYLIECRDNSLPYRWRWLNEMLSEVGYREYRQWP